MLAVTFKVADASILMSPAVSIEECSGLKQWMCFVFFLFQQAAVTGNALAGEMRRPIVNSSLVLEPA